MDRIVVGVDGSPSSDAALRWAVEEAARRGASVDAVHVWTYPPLAALPVPSPSLVEFDRGAWDHLERLLGKVPVPAGVRVEGHAVQGHPVGVLLSMLGPDAVLVVGAGKHHARVGSTAFRCAMHAEQPVVVVPDPASRAA